MPPGLGTPSGSLTPPVGTRKQTPPGSGTSSGSLIGPNRTPQRTSSPPPATSPTSNLCRPRSAGPLRPLERMHQRPQQPTAQQSLGHQHNLSRHPNTPCRHACATTPTNPTPDTHSRPRHSSCHPYPPLSGMLSKTLRGRLVGRTSPGQAPHVQALVDWMLAQGSGPGSLHAAKLPRPGSRETPESTVSSRPGSRESAIRPVNASLVYD
jgi:hypothetical protein